jgi:hypothetical protein
VSPPLSPPLEEPLSVPPPSAPPSCVPPSPPSCDPPSPPPAGGEQIEIDIMVSIMMVALTVHVSPGVKHSADVEQSCAGVPRAVFGQTIVLAWHTVVVSPVPQQIWLLGVGQLAALVQAGPPPASPPPLLLVLVPDDEPLEEEPDPSSVPPSVAAAGEDELLQPVATAIPREPALSAVTTRILEICMGNVLLRK